MFYELKNLPPYFVRSKQFHPNICLQFQFTKLTGNIELNREYKNIRSIFY